VPIISARPMERPTKEILRHLEGILGSIVGWRKLCTNRSSLMI
jgi:hypothetical protein